MTLTEFLLARIYDDECLARMAFADHNGNGPDWSEQWSGAVEMGGDEHELLLCNDSGVSRHIENFDPARALAECEKNRTLLFLSEHGCGDDYERVQRALALPYAEHPDFRREWKS